MNMFFRTMALAGIASLLLCGNFEASAQPAPGGGGQGGPGGPGGGRGNFDPAQMRQQMMDRYREQFEIKNDDEWKLIEERVTKVMEAQRATRSGGMMGFMGMGGPGGRGGQRGNDQGAQPGQDNQNRRRQGGFGGTPNPEMEALQKAIESKASSQDIKDKLTKLRETRKQKEADLEKAQDELRQVLSVRQEAAAVMLGLLK